MHSFQTVFVVDDNPMMLQSLGGYLRAANLPFETFESAEKFLSAYSRDRSGCLVLDIDMPEMSGVELQESMAAKGCLIPIIVVSGNATVKDVVRTMKLGALDFLEKPYDPGGLLRLIREALSLDRRRRQEDSALAVLKDRYNKLTDREKQILGLVVAGHQSKVIAGLVGLSVSTIDNHRANIMKKLGAATSADLTRMVLSVDPALAVGKS